MIRIVQDVEAGWSHQLHLRTLILTSKIGNG